MIVDVSSGLTVGGLATAVAAGIVGFVAHELVHIGVLSLFGNRPRVEIGFERLIFAAVPPDGTPRWQLASALLAPVAVAVVGTWALFSNAALGALSVPLTLDGVLVLAAFLIAALPSPADVYVLLMYDPAAQTPGVAADG